MTMGESSPGLPTDLTAGSKRCQAGGKAGVEREATSGSTQRGCCCTVVRKGTQSPEVVQEL